MLALLALQAVPVFSAQLSGTPPFPLPVLGFPLLVARKAVCGKGWEGQEKVRAGYQRGALLQKPQPQSRWGERGRGCLDTADRTPLPQNSPQLTSREDLALGEVQVHIASAGVRGMGTLGSSGP